MTNTMVVDGEKINSAIDYTVVKTINNFDIMTFSVSNDDVNRNRFRIENDIYFELLKEWGLITRRRDC